jgi:hypothetical protein
MGHLSPEKGHFLLLKKGGAHAPIAPPPGSVAPGFGNPNMAGSTGINDNVNEY